MSIAVFVLILLCSPVWATPVDDIVPRTFPVPDVTDWRPIGCRDVPFEDPVQLPRTAFRRAHGDLDSSDEVEAVYAPVFEREWGVETSLYQVTTPAFDSAGNVYMTPLLPREPVLLLSLDAETGNRRFVIPLEPGQKGGGAVPLVLRDPESGADVVYVNAYSRALAVRADGTVLWDVETGLGDALTPAQSPIGLAWVPNADAIVAQTRDGYVILLDRRSGSVVVPARRLPGQPSPSRPSTIPPDLADTVDELLTPFIAFSSGGGVVDLIDVLLGGNSVIANNLSVDARTGRLWIASTARDEDDGAADGVSEFGALYRFDVVAHGDGWDLVEVCHRAFSGGSASTPGLSRDGSRAYLGDDSGTLIAINTDDCSDAWEVALDSQIFGSVAVASDGRELYAASADGIYQVFDDGENGRRGWTASLDLYEIPDDLVGYGGMNLLLTGIGANGLLIQAGAGLRTGTQNLPVRTGVAYVDRLTGQARWFADGLEESLGAMSTGPDGALYLPQAPLRRAFSLALEITDQPLLGGVSKWSATRYDLLMRDASCAAADRGHNAFDNAERCPSSARADAVQMTALIAQVREDAAPRALERGEIDDTLWRRIDRRLGSAELALATYLDDGAAADLREASKDLDLVCSLLVDPPGGPVEEADDDSCQVCRPGRPGASLLMLVTAGFLLAFGAARRRNSQESE